MNNPQNFSSYDSIAVTTGRSHVDSLLVTSTAYKQFILDSPASKWTIQRAFLLALFLLLLPKALSSFGLLKLENTKDQCRIATPVTYLIPILGNLFMFLYDPQELVRSIT